VLGKQHRRAFKIIHPGRIAAALVSQVWGEQDMELVIGQGALLRDKRICCNTVSRWGSVTICFSIR
jgi:hypothetical protein